MEDNLKSIYDYLSSKGGQGSYEEFVDFFNANDDNKHTIYDYMAKEGGQGSYEEFLAFAGTPQRVDVSDVEKANQPNVVTLSEEELTPANVGNYTPRSGVSELKSPKELEASAQLNANKPLYSEWVKGVDADRLNDNYDLEKAYNLLPYEQMETWRTDTTGNTHLPSVADNLNTGTVDFLKRKDHPSLQEELDWYNSDEPSAKKFRDEGWKLDDSGDYYKYVKSEPQMIEKAAQYNIPTEYSPGNYEQVTQRIADLDAERSKIEKRLDLAYDVMLDTDIEPSWVEKDNERLAALNDERNALNEYTKAYGQPHDDYEQQIGKAFSSIDTDNVAEQAWNHAEQLTAEATEKDYENMLSGNKYTAFGQAMIASNPELTGAQSIKNMANRLTYHDLKVMADDAWEKLGEEKQEAVADEIANVLRTYYPEAEDSAIQDASRKIARQQSDQRMYQLAVEKNTPKNTTEYFFRKAVEANSVFKIMDALARSIAGTTGDMQAKEEAMQNFNSGWKTVLNVGGTVTGMVTDPLMYVSGAVGNVATKGVGTGASAIFGRSAMNKFGTTLGGKIAAGAIGGGFNLGTYEAGGEALNQLRWGGDIKGIDDNGYYIIGDYSGKKIARGFGHGFVMGGTIGVIAPTLGNISDNLVRTTSNTGGKVALRAGELGMSTVAEGTVFSIPEFYNTYQQYEELIDSYSNENSPNYIADENKRAQAIDAAISKRKGAMMDVWTDNMAMMAGFKIKSVGQRLGELKSYPNSKAGFETRLRAVLDGSPDLALTKEEKDELVSSGYSDLKELIDAYDSRFQAKEKLPSTVTAEEGGALPVNRFMEMMNDNTISESARAKMYFYITGNVLPMSTIMGGKVIPGEDANGKATFTVQSLGMNGVVTSKTFTSEKAARAEMERISRQTELNLADAGERWYNYRNFKLGKKNATEKLRKDIYNKYYVNVDDAIRKEPNRRSKMEADAVKEYLNTLWADQIEKQAQASWERKQAEADIERIKAAGDELADDLAVSDDPNTFSDAGRDMRDARRELADKIGEDRMQALENMNDADLAEAYRTADKDIQALMKRWMLNREMGKVEEDLNTRSMNYIGQFKEGIVNYFNNPGVGEAQRQNAANGSLTLVDVDGNPWIVLNTSGRMYTIKDVNGNAKMVDASQCKNERNVPIDEFVLAQSTPELQRYEQLANAFNGTDKIFPGSKYAIMGDGQSFENAYSSDAEVLSVEGDNVTYRMWDYSGDKPKDMGVQTVTKEQFRDMHERFLSERDKRYGEVERRIQEGVDDLAEIPVSKMLPGESFPVAWDGQLVVANVNDVNGIRNITITDAKGNVLVEDTRDITDEQWEALRSMAAEMENAPAETTESVETVDNELKPIGEGSFGSIYDQFRGKPKEAIEFLKEKKSGEAIGALSHPQVGEIDLVWGEEGTGKSDGYGLAKLVKYHPEVVDNLQELLNEMEVVSKTENRINLESKTHKAGVRLDWDGVRKTWLMTMFEKKGASELTNGTSDINGNQSGKGNDTAPSQSPDVSTDKDTTISDTSDKKNEKNIPRDKKGNIDHAQLSKDNTEEYKAAVAEELNNAAKFAELGDKDYIGRNLKEAQKQADAAAKKQPKATGAAQLTAELAKINEARQATQRVVEFWKDVNAQVEQAAFDNQARLNQADEALQSLDENMKLYSEAPQEETLDKEPTNKHEFVSTYLGSFQKKENRLNKESLKTELGWSDSDLEKFRGIIAANGGMTLDTMAEMIFAEAQEQYPSFFVDINDAKATIFDVLQEAGDAGNLDTYIKDRRRGGSEVQARLDYEARQLGYEDAADMREKRLADAQQKLESLKDENGFITEEELKEFQDYVEGLKIKEAPVQAETADLNEQVADAGFVNPNETEVPFQKVREENVPLTEEEIELRDALVETLRDAGIDVSTDTEEGQEILDKAIGSDIKFHRANSNQAIFVSNAERAVEAIKQDKATPEQWLKMIEKSGGLKVGEDKWLGLSEWLKAQSAIDAPRGNESIAEWADRNKKKTLTKQEILDFINKNKIKIEEVQYGNLSSTSKEMEPWQEEFKEAMQEAEGLYNKADAKVEAFYQEMEEKYGEDYLEMMTSGELSIEDELLTARESVNTDYHPAYKIAFDRMVEDHGNDFALAFYPTPTGLQIDHEDIAEQYVNVNPINGVRLDYTTGGLDNKREIALTVPTIEPWNRSDSIHFGDAGEGRAIAWVRFGETTAERELTEDELAKIMPPAEQWEKVDGSNFVVNKDIYYYPGTRNTVGKSYIVDMGNGIFMIGGPMTRRMMVNTFYSLEDAVNAYNKQYAKDHGKTQDRILVIDEIQSKRHQEGRENGYKHELPVEGIHVSEYVPVKDEKYKDRMAFADVLEHDNIPIGKIQKIDGKYRPIDSGGQNIGFTDYDNEADAVDAVRKAYATVEGIPAAPFEKNWQELAMKRMLRLAAEEGYDKLAWTTGSQQAQRYNIGDAVDSIDKNESNDIDEQHFTINWRSGGNLNLTTDNEGNITHSLAEDFRNKTLADVVGKELANKLLSANENTSLDGKELVIGGEGMKGFYDKMLVSFMNKYGKKWGVKVGEVTMPNLEEGYQTMHSIDITPEMKKDVMEGLVMFFRTSDGKVYGFTKDGKIYVDPSIATSETPIHEYMHLWAEALRSANIEAWKHLTEELKKDKDTWNYVKNLYPELEGDDLIEEVFAHFSGKRGAERLRAEQKRMTDEAKGKRGIAKVAKIFDNIRKALSKFWNAARKLFAGNNEDLEKLSIEDLADMATNDMLNGFNPRKVKAKEAKAKDKEYITAIESGDMTKAQEMVDEAAERAGYTIRGYHGTTHLFTIFDKSKGNAEGNWGKGFYFTNNEDDANSNYATSEGPDLNSRIEQMAEQMEWMDGYEDMDYEQRKEEARKILDGGQQRIISAALHMENPLVIGGNSDMQETYFDYNEEYDEENDEYGEPSGLLVDFADAWNDVINSFEWDAFSNLSASEILEYGFDGGLTASQLEDKAREVLDSHGIQNYDGNMATGDFLRQVFERMGFDGIVDSRVNIKFGTQRRYGKSMEGMDYGTLHFIVNEPNQIKQTDPVTYDDNGKVIPLSERFNEKSNDIRFQKADEGVTQPESSSEEELNKYNAGTLSTKEVVAKTLAEAAAKNKDDANKRLVAINAISKNLHDLALKLRQMSRGTDKLSKRAEQNIRGAVSGIEKATADYDKATIDQIVRLSKILMDSKLFKDFSNYEVRRLLAVTRDATGSKDITKQAEKVVDIMLDHALKEAESIFENQMKIQGSKVGVNGVEVQGKLDVAGQRMMKALKEAMKLDADALADRMAEVQDNLGSEDKTVADNAAIEMQALQIAQQYQETIAQSEADEAELHRQVEVAKENGVKGDALKELKESVDEAIMKNKADRLDAYLNLTKKLGGEISDFMNRARAFREKEMQRVRDIQHNANSDLEGISASEHSKASKFADRVNSSLVRFFMKPLATFNDMLQLFGSKSVNGRGYLFNRFMPQWQKALDDSTGNFRKDCDELGAKVSEVMGKKMRWSDLFSIERKMPTINVKFLDDGEMTDHEMSQGQALYIYMVNKMTDGKMKLRAMGITEEDVDRITKEIDPRFIELADWVQDEYLPRKRNDFNTVHERMFGAPMAAIEDYFPLEINSRSRGQVEDISKQDMGDTKPSTTTGSIIKRKVNTIALDLTNADAFNVLLGHLQDMEHWAAYAEFNRDLNTLLSYKRFKNRVLNMETVRYGAGETLWKNFKDAAAIAADVYHPMVNRQSLDTAAVNISKGVTSAKIAFRAYTALKQLLSYPAYFGEANVVDLVKNTLMPARAFNWALDELPGFEQRWRSRQAGDSRLKDTDVDWGFWKNKIVDTARRWGMTPNAFVDGLTVAMGARAIYETKYRQFKKDGLSDADAKKKALSEASVAYNETQQSSQNAYLSAMQLDRTVASVALTVFRNASMGYERKFLRSLDNLKRKATLGKKEMIDFMTKQGVREGLTEEQAKKAAERAWKRSWYQDAINTLIFGFVMQFAWNLGSYMAYLIGGDDDNEKDAMLEDAAMHAIAGPVEGLTGGSVISEVYNMARSGQKISNYQFNLLPIIGDIQSTVKHLEQDEVRGLNDIVNLVIQAGVGVNPQTITDVVAAIVDATNGDMEAGKEVAMLMMRIAQVPQSQLDKLYIDELGLNAADAKKLSAEQLAKRYAAYKVHRDTPITGWMYSEEGKDKAIDRYEKRFDKLIQERVAKMEEEDLEKGMEGTDIETKNLIGKEIANRMGGQDKAGSKPSSNWNEDTKIAHETYQKLRSYRDVVEDVLLQNAQKEADEAYEQALKDGDMAKAKEYQKRANRIEDVRRNILEKKHSLGKKGGEKDAERMEKIRAYRKKKMQDLGIK